MGETLGRMLAIGAPEDDAEAAQAGPEAAAPIGPGPPVRINECRKSVNE